MARRTQEQEPERPEDTLPVSDPTAPEAKPEGKQFVRKPRDEDQPVTREDRTDYDEAGGPLPKV
jgi:hypothetical protein